MCKSRIAGSLLSLFGQCLTGVFVLLPLTVLGVGTTNVSIVDFAFNPSAVTIQVNDVVTWNWAGPSEHSSTSDTSVWDSGVMPQGSTFSFTFKSAGAFPYHCVVHPFMTASVTVQGVAKTNVPPVVSISSPANGAMFTAPWSGAIKVSDSDADGTVVKIAFFAGTMHLGTITNPAAAASFTVTNLAAGNYALTAVATDNGGASTTSAAVNIIVTAIAGSITIGSPRRPSDTSFQFSYGTTAGLNYVVGRSSDSLHWNALATNSATGTSATFTDTTASNAAGFYRVMLLPHP